MKLPISKRLLCCAAQVPYGARVADIGCDHGYLSIHLLQNGQAVFAHASDLREKPLQKARENAALFGVAEKMQFSCADGLSAVAPDSVDTVVCAGMGADTICSILAQTPWLKASRILLILQPQSSGQDLRRTLMENGFGLLSETLVEDGGFLYTVLTARYGTPAALTPGQQYVSAQLLEERSPLLPRYVRRILDALTQTVAGMEKANGQVPQERLDYYRTALREVAAIWEEL